MINHKYLEEWLHAIQVILQSKNKEEASVGFSLPLSFHTVTWPSLNAVTSQLSTFIKHFTRMSPTFISQMISLLIIS